MNADDERDHEEEAANAAHLEGERHAWPVQAVALAAFLRSPAAPAFVRRVFERLAQEVEEERERIESYGHGHARIVTPADVLGEPFAALEHVTLTPAPNPVPADAVVRPVELDDNDLSELLGAAWDAKSGGMPLYVWQDPDDGGRLKVRVGFHRWSPAFGEVTR